MNILWLSHLIPYPPKGGVLQRSFNLIKEVSNYNDVYLLAFNQKAMLPTVSSVKDAIKELIKICKVVKVIDIPCEKRKHGKNLLLLKSIFTVTPYTINWLHSKEMARMIKDTVENYHIDLVHFDTISLAPFYSIVKKYKKILNHHNIESAMMFRRSQKEPNIFKKIYMKQEAYKISYYEKRLCKEFDLNITCSKLDSQLLLKTIPELIVDDVPNGVDLGYFYPMNLPKDKNSLIFAGRMNAYSNISAMVFFADKIWPLLKKEIPDIKITIIGKNPPTKLVNLSQSDSNFNVIGFVEDVRPYLDKAMIYVCPIYDGGGTRLKILDALAMGRPIVAYPIAVEGIDVEPEKHLLIAKTPQEFVNQIKRLFNDQKLCHNLSGSGRRLVEEKYDFKKIGDKLSRIYIELGNKK